MAFADPQSVTINAVAQTLPRVGTSQNSSNYRKDDGNVTLTISHQKVGGGKRDRRTVRLDHRKIAADPLLGSVNIQYSMSAYVVFDVPTIGYTVAEAKQIVDALSAYLTASTGANVTKVLGGES